MRDPCKAVPCGLDSGGLALVSLSPEAGASRPGWLGYGHFVLRGQAAGGLSRGRSKFFIVPIAMRVLAFV